MRAFAPEECTAPSPQVGPANTPEFLGAAPKIEVSDEYLLKEWVDCFATVCATFPFLRSKTSQLI